MSQYLTHSNSIIRGVAAVEGVVFELVVSDVLFFITYRRFRFKVVVLDEILAIGYTGLKNGIRVPSLFEETSLSKIKQTLDCLVSSITTSLKYLTSGNLLIRRLIECGFIVIYEDPNLIYLYVGSKIYVIYQNTRKYRVMELVSYSEGSQPDKGIIYEGKFQMCSISDSIEGVLNYFNKYCHEPKIFNT